MESISARTRPIEEDLIEWMDFSLTGEQQRQKILRAVEAEMGGGPKTGLEPYRRDSLLCFTQRDLAIVGQRLPRAQLDSPSGPASG